VNYVSKKQKQYKQHVGRYNNITKLNKRTNKLEINVIRSNGERIIILRNVVIYNLPRGVFISTIDPLPKVDEPTLTYIFLIFRRLQLTLEGICFV